tara:strand:+ start:234 stop:500 length:267 start_codon:yes stop_codon:yes gene_type:complete
MKLFFYKSILVLFLFLLGFHYSFNYIVKSVKKNVENNLSKSQIESVKDKVREEMKDAINKDKFISDEDAKLINKFLEKISSDLNKNSK